MFPTFISGTYWLSTQNQTVQGTCEIPPRNYPYAHIYTTAPARIIVDEDSNEDNHTGSATFIHGIHGKAVTINNADFYRMNIDGVAYLKQAASSANQKTLSWKQVSPSGTTDYPQGYVLTSHSGLTPDEDDDNSSTGDDDNGSGSTKTWQKVAYNNNQLLSSCPYDLKTNNHSGTSTQACNSWTWKGKNVAACGMQPVAGQSCSLHIDSYCYTNCRISGNTSAGCYYYADLWICKQFSWRYKNPPPIGGGFLWGFLDSVHIIYAMWTNRGQIVICGQIYHFFYF